MQNRYVGDIGDYIKFALLRKLSTGHKLAILWYLYPDEDHNSDGRHISYLQDEKRWSHLDPVLFAKLQYIVQSHRSTRGIEKAAILDAVYHTETLDFAAFPSRDRDKMRTKWFSSLKQQTERCDLIFADPDNGLVDASPWRRSNKKFGKHISILEAIDLAEGRTAVVYHHNSRFKGGHDKEVDHWRHLLGEQTIAVRANAFSCRTFFIINPSKIIARRVSEFCKDWSNHKVWLHGS